MFLVKARLIFLEAGHWRWEMFRMPHMPWKNSHFMRKHDERIYWKWESIFPLAIHSALYGTAGAVAGDGSWSEPEAEPCEAWTFKDLWNRPLSATERPRVKKIKMKRDQNEIKQMHNSSKSELSTETANGSIQGIFQSSTQYCVAAKHVMWPANLCEPNERSWEISDEKNAPTFTVWKQRGHRKWYFDWIYPLII